MCEDCIRICNAIGELNAEEGNGVNILAANHGFIGANYAIEATGDWTNWQPVRFEGKTMPEALEYAVATKRDWMRAAT
jgi:hypothetical protein